MAVQRLEELPQRVGDIFGIVALGLTFTKFFGEVANQLTIQGQLAKQGVSVIG